MRRVKSRLKGRLDPLRRDPHRRPKPLLALYEGKGLRIARAGAPSPLSTLSGRQISS
jgi:hypothetical protein